MVGNDNIFDFHADVADEDTVWTPKVEEARKQAEEADRSKTNEGTHYKIEKIYDAKVNGIEEAFGKLANNILT